ncbi:ATP synthase F1 subunit epsilon [Flammeovirgaceae bacterium SG7u.111]|nr:ATP synthase F1 subunit epsilon [Flammeovirgaceae bacterium SG7u.132]WPO35910.1 ATP synthase F1 subunit epsilon [Flammeovirgaceae bacterium SG7u.111]
MYLEIITPDKKVFEGEVTGVKVPGSAGTFEMLNNHAPIVSTLARGEVRVKQKDGRKTFEIDGGLVEMRNNKVVILTEALVSE